MISTNIKIARDLFENVVKRERKKRDMTYVVTDWQQLQIKQKFNPKSDQDAVSCLLDCFYLVSRSFNATCFLLSNVVRLILKEVHAG